VKIKSKKQKTLDNTTIDIKENIKPNHLQNIFKEAHQALNLSTPAELV